MIYKQFFTWLRDLIIRDENHNHQWKQVEITFSLLKELWSITETGFRHKFVCTICAKKKTLLPREVPSKYDTL
jgi:hypothetical protein